MLGAVIKLHVITMNWQNVFLSIGSATTMKNTRRKNVINAEYPEHMTVEIMISVRESGIVQHVNGDPDQLRLIGRDLVDRMSSMD